MCCAGQPGSLQQPQLLTQPTPPKDRKAEGAFEADHPSSEQLIERARSQTLGSQPSGRPNLGPNLGLLRNLKEDTLPPERREKAREALHETLEEGGLEKGSGIEAPSLLRFENGKEGLPDALVTPQIGQSNGREGDGLDLGEVGLWGKGIQAQSREQPQVEGGQGLHQAGALLRERLAPEEAEFLGSGNNGSGLMERDRGGSKGRAIGGLDISDAGCSPYSCLSAGDGLGVGAQFGAQLGKEIFGGNVSAGTRLEQEVLLGDVRSKALTVGGLPSGAGMGKAKPHETEASEREENHLGTVAGDNRVGAQEQGGQNGGGHRAEKECREQLISGGDNTETDQKGDGEKGAEVGEREKSENGGTREGESGAGGKAGQELGRGKDRVARTEGGISGDRHGEEKERGGENCEDGPRYAKRARKASVKFQAFDKPSPQKPCPRPPKEKADPQSYIKGWGRRTFPMKGGGFQSFNCRVVRVPCRPEGLKSGDKCILTVYPGYSNAKETLDENQLIKALKQYEIAVASGGCEREESMDGGRKEEEERSLVDKGKKRAADEGMSKREGQKRAKSARGSGGGQGERLSHSQLLCSTFRSSPILTLVLFAIGNRSA
jgi:hypothetical protein